MKELITLQIGDFANFVGSHFWNFQDELLGLAESPSADKFFRNTGFDMDTLYRCGETRQGVETYTPRLLAIDLRGSLGAVSSRGSVYGQPPVGDSSTVTSWKGRVSTFKEEPTEKNLFLERLETEYECGTEESNEFVQQGHSYIPLDHEIVEDLQDRVRFWTDYLKAQMHPSSIFEIQGAWHGLTNFQHFGTGREWLSEASQAEEFQDRFRHFLEDCDCVQGIQVIVDDSGGFSGVATDVLEGLMDDYGKCPLMLFTVRPPQMDVQHTSMKNNIGSILHDAVSLAKLSTLCNLLVPVEICNFSVSELSRHLCIKETSFFDSSAIYAAAINNVTLPFRMKTPGPSDVHTSYVGNCDMETMLRLLTWSPSRKVAGLAAALPAPPISGAGKSPDLTKMTWLSPFKENNVHDSLSVEAVVFQGSTGRASVPEIVDFVHTCYRNCSKRVNLAHLAVSLCPLAIPLPFPRIFKTSPGYDNDIQGDGSIQKHVQSDVTSVSVAGKLITSQAVIPYLKKNYDNLQRFGLSRVSVGSSLLQQWGFPGEEASELKETLSEMIAAFGDSSMDTTTSESE